MKYYSEKTKKMYDDVKLLEKAETEYDKEHELEIKKKEEKSKRAKEIENAYSKVINDYKVYKNLIAKFVEDYGAYHKSYYGNENLLDSFWDNFFNLF